MKVGIVTLSASDNCGSLLQAYALQRVLEKSFSVNVEILNLKTKQSDAVYALFPQGFYKHPKKTLFTILNYKRLKKQREDYQSFRNKYLKLTKVVFRDESEMKKVSGQYDVLISGSDQVWNVYMSDFSEAFYLPWDDTAKKVAYAASLGSALVIDDMYGLKISRWLKDFSNISVREMTGKQTIENYTDKDIMVTADPTLLIGRDEWDKVTGERKIMSPYIFYYSWSYPDIEMNELVQKFAKDMQMEVYVINPSKWYKQRPNQFGFILADESGPEAFLNYMKYAEYVFVQSFHGAVFANIFEKKYFFLSEGGKDKVDFRVKGLMDGLNQHDRVVQQLEDVNRVINQNIVFTNNEFEKFKECSMEFLANSLKE